MKYLPIIILFLTSKICLSQNEHLIGIYHSDSNYLNIISDSTLEFKTTIGCCLISTAYGYGNYRLIDNKIEVSTVPTNRFKHTRIEIIDTLRNTNQIEIVVQDSNPIFGCNLIVVDKRDRRQVYGKLTDIDGFAIFNDLSTDQVDNYIITISFVGYNYFEIPMTKIIGKSIMVNLISHQIIENQTIFFDVIDNNKITGPIFPKTRESRKFNRKVKTRMIFTRWPWKWKFKDTHKSEPTEFVKQ